MGFLTALSEPESQPRHALQVYDGKRLPDNGRPLADSGVEDGSLLIMLHKRDPPPPRLQRISSTPNVTLAEVERVIREEAARQGRTVEAAPPVQVSVRSVETQLQQLMHVRLLRPMRARTSTRAGTCGEAL